MKKEVKKTQIKDELSKKGSTEGKGAPSQESKRDASQAREGKDVFVNKNRKDKTVT
ncbi:hypothetical protein GW915_02650 [bacterium]|nr:hypothetical protein [bacterium]